MTDKMYLVIDKNYAIKTDKYNWILSKRIGIGAKKYWKNKSYYGSLPKVLQGYLDAVCKDFKVETIYDIPKERSSVVVDVSMVLQHLGFRIEMYGGVKEELVMKIEEPKGYEYTEQEEVEEYDEQYYG